VQQNTRTVSPTDATRYNDAPPVELPAGHGLSAVVEGNRRLSANKSRQQAYAVAERCEAVATGAGLQASLCLSATWRVEPADPDDPKAVEYADHVRRNFGIDDEDGVLAGGFEQLVRELLIGRMRGYCLHEVVAVDLDGSRYAVPLWRDQSTVQYWLVDKAHRLVGIEQASASSGNMSGAAAIIPASRLLHCRWGGVGVDFEGIGALRSVEPDARDLTTLANLRMVAAQRFACASPMAVIDLEKLRSAYPDLDDDRREAVRSTLETLLSRYTSGEHSHIIVEDWVTITAYAPGLSDQFALAKVIDSVRLYVLTSFQAQFLSLGSSGSGGSYSLGEVQADVAVQAASNILDWVISSLRPLVGLSLAYQFGPVPRALWPVLAFGGLRREQWTSQVADLVSLIGAGMVTATPEDEPHIRAALGLPAAVVERSIDERLRSRVSPVVAPVVAPQRPAIAPRRAT
jgi:hypothetical protein